jgi:hypothetical protein
MSNIGKEMKKMTYSQFINFISNSISRWEHTEVFLPLIDNIIEDNIIEDNSSNVLYFEYIMHSELDDVSIIIQLPTRVEDLSNNDETNFKVDHKYDQLKITLKNIVLIDDDSENPLGQAAINQLYKDLPKPFKEPNNHSLESSILQSYHNIIKILILEQLKSITDTMISIAKRFE